MFLKIIFPLMIPIIGFILLLCRECFKLCKYNDIVCSVIIMENTKLATSVLLLFILSVSPVSH